MDQNVGNLKIQPEKKNPCVEQYVAKIFFLQHNDQEKRITKSNIALSAFLGHLINISMKFPS